MEGVFNVLYQKVIRKPFEGDATKNREYYEKFEFLTPELADQHPYDNTVDYRYLVKLMKKRLLYRITENEMIEYLRETDPDNDPEETYQNLKEESNYESQLSMVYIDQDVGELDEIELNGEIFKYDYFNYVRLDNEMVQAKFGEIELNADTYKKGYQHEVNYFNTSGFHRVGWKKEKIFDAILKSDLPIINPRQWSFNSNIYGETIKINKWVGQSSCMRDMVKAFQHYDMDTDTKKFFKSVYEGDYKKASNFDVDEEMIDIGYLYCIKNENKSKIKEYEKIFKGRINVKDGDLTLNQILNPDEELGKSLLRKSKNTNAYALFYTEDNETINLIVERISSQFKIAIKKSYFLNDVNLLNIIADNIKRLGLKYDDVIHPEGKDLIRGVNYTFVIRFLIQNEFFSTITLFNNLITDARISVPSFLLTEYTNIENLIGNKGRLVFFKKIMFDHRLDFIKYIHENGKEDLFFIILLEKNKYVDLNDLAALNGQQEDIMEYLNIYGVDGYENRLKPKFYLQLNPEQPKCTNRNTLMMGYDVNTQDELILTFQEMRANEEGVPLQTPMCIELNELKDFYFTETEEGEFVWRKPSTKTIGVAESTFTDRDDLRKIIRFLENVFMEPRYERFQDQIAEISEYIRQNANMLIEADEYIEDMRILFNQLNNNDKKLLEEILMLCFEAGMYMRRWLGPGNPYPYRILGREIEFSDGTFRPITNNTYEGGPSYNQVEDELVPVKLVEIMERVEQLSEQGTEFYNKIREYTVNDITRETEYTGGLLTRTIRSIISDRRALGNCIQLQGQYFIVTGYKNLRIMNVNIPDFDITQVRFIHY